MSMAIPLQALTLDLDDTLWPVMPTIRRAEIVLLDWLRQHAPATAAAHDPRAMRALREAVGREWTHLAHDLNALRQETIRRALVAAGDDPALAAPAFEVFFAERQRVDLYEDVRPALDRLAARWPLVALSNGNADIGRVGLGRYFVASVSAREFGIGKPAAPIFHAACARAGAAPQAVLHIGDDASTDVDGALDAGLRAAWVQRPDAPNTAPPRGQPHHHVGDLSALAQLLGV